MLETRISRAIVETYTRKFLDSLDSDVIVVGAGPAGLCAAYYLAGEGLRTVVFEKKLSTGGGIWGGGMGNSQLVVEDTEILDELGVASEPCGDLYTADAVELASALAYRASKAGAKVLNLCHVEDLVVKGGVVQGVVLNATPIVMAGLHVDPICAAARLTVDATGHQADLLRMLRDKAEGFQPADIGEGFMDVEAAEAGVVERTGRIYPGLYVAGMSVCAAYNLPRMGPIFGGMLKSGRRAAELVANELASR